MKRNNKEINIFSMSALDLFASALGAFIILTVIFMPFFPNTFTSASEEKAKLQSLRQQTADLSAANAALDKSVKDCKIDLKATTTKLDACTSDLDAAKKNAADAGALNQQLKSLRSQNQQLQKKADNLSKDLGSQKDRVSLLGIETKAKSIVFVIDLSGSMKGASSTKVDYRPLLTSSVLGAMRGLNDGTRVSMIGFQGDDTLRYWPSRTDMRPLNASSISAVKSQLNSWMSLVGDTTPTEKALMQALKYKPDAIILLSDGQPNGSWQSVVANVTRANGGRTEIHAVAVGPFWGDGKFVRFLGELTAKNKGNLTAAVPSTGSP